MEPQQVSTWHLQLIRLPIAAEPVVAKDIAMFFFELVQIERDSQTVFIQ
jgi:hypothetical protein